MDNSLAESRELWNNVDDSTYLYSVNDDTIIDARTIGNKARFANHSKRNANTIAKIEFNKGEDRIGLYAKRDICKFEEILFDYDGLGLMEGSFDWLNPSKKLGRKRKSNNNNG